MKILLHLLFIVIIIISLGILGYRAVYDFHLIRDGDSFVIQKSTPDGYDFLLRIPRGYNDYSGKQPLLIFLHGAGGSSKYVRFAAGRDPYSLSRKTFEGQETALFPFICVTPVCDTKRWEPYRVIALLDQVLKENHRFQIDPSRIYLTGYSMGGFGTLATAMEYPDRFTAFVPVAGGGEPSWANKLQNVPIWIFHGESDTAVPLPSSSLLFDELEKLNAPNVRRTTINGAGHRIDTDVYSRAELYQWLLEQRLLDNRAGSDAGDFINGRSSR